MNPGQEQFMNFILERVRKDKMEEAKEVLLENFRKQDEGSFSKEDIASFGPKILRLLKEEAVSEVQNVMKQFGQQH